ncbi:hypothetical protein HYALB_00002103 [Hymenoscyphus albidus]|uniref:DUF7029 domain-containing protein n=1 Tax=Hymenoscyphus albidus TaxID=595503 RepID=A0A9N9Q1X8_9HELO|nr:hypothetical protein HYALB_00002103 [Hymenoscyphus albidus]
MSPISTMAIILAAGFSSVASGAPTTILTEFDHGSDPFFTSNTLDRHESIAHPQVILAPVRSTGSRLIPANHLTKRQASIVPRADRMNPLIPQTNITLDYQSPHDDGEVVILSQVNAIMKYPSVLLEECPVTRVDCSEHSVNITFDNVDRYRSATDAWPKSDFILFTNHLGDCDVDNERGLYMVNEITFDDETSSVIAATTNYALKDSTKEIEVVIAKATAATRKRATISKEFDMDFPDAITLGKNDTNSDSSIPYISVTDPEFGGSIALSGHVKYNMFNSKASVFTFDLDLTLASSANFEFIAGSKTGSQSYNFDPHSISVAAFQIPGIMQVGPRMQFGIGADVGASGQVIVKAELASRLDDGNVHIDFLNPNNTAATGWVPTYTHHANVSNGVDTHVNPRLEFGASIGAKFLDVIDIFGGIKAKASLTNEFSLKGFTLVTGSNYNTTTHDNWNTTAPISNDGTCLNGLRYTSAFKLGIYTSVTTFHDREILSFNRPFGDKCWSWAESL